MCCQSVVKVGRHQHKTNLSFICSGILGQGIKNNVKQGALKQYSSLFFVQLQGMTMAPLKFGPLIFGVFVRLPATSRLHKISNDYNYYSNFKMCAAYQSIKYQSTSLLFFSFWNSSMS